MFALFDALQNSLYPDEKEPEASPLMKYSEQEGQKYEESILVTVLGDNYMEFIDQETGQWE